MQQTTHPGLSRKQIGSSQRLSREHRSRIANALMHLVNDGCFVAIYPILPLITLEFDLKYARVILLNTDRLVDRLSNPNGPSISGHSSSNGAVSLEPHRDALPTASTTPAI